MADSCNTVLHYFEKDKVLNHSGISHGSAHFCCLMHGCHSKIYGKLWKIGIKQTHKQHGNRLHHMYVHTHWPLRLDTRVQLLINTNILSVNQITWQQRSAFKHVDMVSTAY